MPGSWWSVQRRPVLSVARGAVLTFVFAGVLAAGAAAGSWGAPPQQRAVGAQLGPDAALGAAPGAADVEQQAPQRDGTGTEPRADERDGARGQHPDDAEELVSRSDDRWAASYTAREYAGMRRALDGTYVGVGLSLTGGGQRGRAQLPRVAAVHPQSPAATAGLRKGDRLVSVEGAAVRGVPVTKVVGWLRGASGTQRAAEPGSRVHVTLERTGRRWSEELDRKRLNSRAVTVHRLGDGAARVRVTAFTRGVGEQVQRAVAAQPPGAGVLLDLRGNSGGLVEEAVQAAGAFLDGGLVATYDDGGQRALYAERGGDEQRPVTVLVDGGTMSAGELLAGALQDRGRAVVVGSRTFGKGAVQLPRRLPDGSVAELTVGYYRTPDGHRVEGAGIGPDLRVEEGSDAVDPEQRARRVLGGLGTGA